MKLRPRFFALFAVVAASAAHAAPIADLASDFHLGSNSGPWTYGYSTDPTSLVNFNLYNSTTGVPAAYAPNPIVGWSSTSSPTGIYPYVAYNTDDWSGYGINFKKGDVMLHPGNANSHLFSIARYTADSNLGYVSVSSLFTRLESSSASTYGLYKNGLLLGGGTATGVNAPFAVNKVVLLSLGDKLDVVVGPGNDQYFGDVNRVSASISSVPGPAAVAPFLMGGLSFLRKRRKR